VKLSVNGKEIWMACISTQRPSNVPKISKHDSFTWYVCPNEASAYTAAGAQSVVEVAGNIVAARNRAIADAAANHCEYCLQISDDVTRFVEYDNATTYHAVPFSYVLNKMTSFARGNVHLIGLSIQMNTRNYKPSYYTTNKLVVNDCIMIHTEQRFDEEADLKEDYDMFLTLTTRGYKVVRLDNLAGAFPHRENKGGANTYRTFFREQRCNLYILSKWKSLVRTHRTRVNQIEIVYKHLPKFPAIGSAAIRRPADASRSTALASA